ncbi:hypothetical protein QM996_25840 (plasmid) [Sinorhizobium chiapasense]
MNHKHRYDKPRRSSTELPIGLMLLAILGIAAYLFVAGAFSGKSQNVAVYLPQTAASDPR